MIEKALNGEGEISNTDSNSILSQLQTEQKHTKRKFSHVELINYLFVLLVSESPYWKASLTCSSVAGGGTVAITLGAVFYYLMKSPAAYNTLRKEIDKHDIAGCLSSIPTHEQTLEIPYL